MPGPQILFRIADEIHRRAEELADVLVMEGGKTRKFAASEVARAEMTVRFVGGRGKTDLRGDHPARPLARTRRGGRDFSSGSRSARWSGLSRSISRSTLPATSSRRRLPPGTPLSSNLRPRPRSRASSLAIWHGCCRPPPGSDQRGALHECPGRAACPRPPRCLSLVHRAAAP